jgi:hypothetical protein
MAKGVLLMKKGGRFSGLTRKQRRNKIIAVVVVVLLTANFVLGPIMMFFG